LTDELDRFVLVSCLLSQRNNWQRQRVSYTKE
jgi:hypothetical protein